jgi:hypothetical protein
MSDFDLEYMDKLLVLMQKHGVRRFELPNLKLEIVPMAPPAPAPVPTAYQDPVYKEPEMPMSMAMWGAKYNG